MNALENLLRTQGELITYTGFLGLFVILAILEWRFELNEVPANRRRRWTTNMGLTLLNIFLLGAIPVSAIAFADFVSVSGLGLFNALELSAWVAFIVGLLIRSFASWWVHLTMHKAPLLWRIHRVHHTDHALDVSTTVRFHPLEFLIHIPVGFGLIYVFGIPAVAILFYELMDALINVFSHSNVKLPRKLSRILGWVIVTPDIHHVHHSSWYKETDSNYGATLVIWDRLFGTYVEKSQDALQHQELGLKETQNKRPNSLSWLLSLPFRGLSLRQNGK